MRLISKNIGVQDTISDIIKAWGVEKVIDGVISFLSQYGSSSKDSRLQSDLKEALKRYRD